jgi:hypothetical protein
MPPVPSAIRYKPRKNTSYWARIASGQTDPSHGGGLDMGTDAESVSVLIPRNRDEISVEFQKTNHNCTLVRVFSSTLLALSTSFEKEN